MPVAVTISHFNLYAKILWLICHAYSRQNTTNRGSANSPSMSRSVESKIRLPKPNKTAVLSSMLASLNLKIALRVLARVEAASTKSC